MINNKLLCGYTIGCAYSEKSWGSFFGSAPQKLLLFGDFTKRETPETPEKERQALRVTVFKTPPNFVDRIFSTFASFYIYNEVTGMKEECWVRVESSLFTTVFDELRVSREFPARAMDESKLVLSFMGLYKLEGKEEENLSQLYAIYLQDRYNFLKVPVEQQNRRNLFRSYHYKYSTHQFGALPSPKDLEKLPQQRLALHMFKALKQFSLKQEEQLQVGGVLPDAITFANCWDLVIQKKVSEYSAKELKHKVSDPLFLQLLQSECHFSGYDEVTKQKIQMAIGYMEKEGCSFLDAMKVVLTPSLQTRIYQKAVSFFIEGQETLSFDTCLEKAALHNPDTEEDRFFSDPAVFSVSKQLAAKGMRTNEIESLIQVARYTLSDLPFPEAIEVATQMWDMKGFVS